MPNQLSGSPLTRNDRRSNPGTASNGTSTRLAAWLPLLFGASACVAATASLAAAPAPSSPVSLTAVAASTMADQATASPRLSQRDDATDDDVLSPNASGPTNSRSGSAAQPSGAAGSSNAEIPARQLVWSIVILAAAALVQATVGFAAALFGLPLLLWAGNDLMQAQVLIITAMLPQNIFAVWKLREHLDWREIVWPASIRIAALPIGIAGLSSVMTWSSESVNQLVGVIILIAIALQSLVGVEWKGARRPHWLVITFGGSGVLQGLSGMSGPPMVLWVHAQSFSANRARAFLFAMYISNFPPQVGLLYSRFGIEVLYAVQTALLAIPAVLIFAALGLRLGSRLGDRWLRPVTYACLIALATASIVEPWLVKNVVPMIFGQS